jgi:hypothetical protein
MSLIIFDDYFDRAAIFLLTHTQLIDNKFMAQLYLEK